MNMELLKSLAVAGEMPAQEWLRHVPRRLGNYRDFYAAAALLHGRLAQANSVNDGGLFGETTQQTAEGFCQLMLKPGDSFMVDGCARESWHDFEVAIFITAEGLLRLDELERRRQDREFAMRLAIGAAIISAVATALLSMVFR